MAKRLLVYMACALALMGLLGILPVAATDGDPAVLSPERDASDGTAETDAGEADRTQRAATTPDGTSSARRFAQDSRHHVTGDGWFVSSAGTWSVAPRLSGRATFRFDAANGSGAAMPAGQLVIRFEPAGPVFRSTGYDWLVAIGGKAQLMGSGTLDGAGTYRFRLTLVDGRRQGLRKPDLLRIRIWDMETGAIVYDSQLGDEEGKDPTTALGGGSVVIHL
jgi:hypothetical protein